MKKYILFGAGQYGKEALNLIGTENVIFIVDNDEVKSGTELEGVPVHYFYDVLDRLHEACIVLSVSEKYENQLSEQLKKCNIAGYKTMGQIKAEIIKEKILSRTDYLSVYQKAVSWIHRNSVNEEAIICNSSNPKGYPEVTGYYIPTLLRWGYRDLAIAYAEWLCSIQKEDGSWYDTDDIAPYVFDTAQILKGLLAVRKICPQVDSHIRKGCDWILTNVQESGRLVTPSAEAWGTGRECSELIHLYCLSPLVDAGRAFGVVKYEEVAQKVLQYYKQNHYDEIMNFSFLSHFYAYVMEALVDMGEIEMAQAAMNKVAQLQRDNGAIPAYYDVDWVCSTGVFQLALVWFRLGDTTRGNRAFEFACKLQNESGGWYGSYLAEENALEKNDYFPASEISWAVKYFLDALYYKSIAEFDLSAHLFLDTIDENDGRYVIIKNVVLRENEEKKAPISVLDVGCGKGRYLKNLIEMELPIHYCAVDLSENVLKFINNPKIEKKQGSLTMIPYENDAFDVAYTCEALEHAVDIRSAIKEICRVVRSGGKIAIIDKNTDNFGCMEIGKWEQWLDEEKTKLLMEEFCITVEVSHGIDYENNRIPGLFSAWIGTVR